MKHTLLLAILLLLGIDSTAQEYHFIFFADKDPSIHGDPSNFLSQRSLDRRAKQGIEIGTNDYPVTPAYLEAIADKGARIKYSITCWFNAALVEADAQVIASIQELDFVRSADPLSRRKGGTRVNEAKERPIRKEQSITRQTESYDYGAAFLQNSLHEIHSMHSDGFEGQGIDIAVIDAGFSKVDQLPVFEDLMTSGRLKGTYDFVMNNEHVFAMQEGESSIDDDHGTKVLSVIAALEDGEMVGTAPKANYWLLKSEDVSFELPLEEIYWAIAAEYADSVGADIIQTSLGYFDFDKSQYNYSQSDFNGDRTWITRAADYAASTGILVVTSSGNQGNRAWGYITAPSDADSILTVGGVYGSGDYWSTSSYGPTADGRIKPNVCGQGVSVAVASTSGNISSSSGTSFASPLIAGLAAGLWQAYPELTNMEILELIEKAGNNAGNPQNNIGYGIPTYTRAKSVMRALSREEDALELLASVALRPNPSINGEVNIELPNELLGQDCRVTITDMSGKIIHTASLNTSQAQHTLTLPKTATNGAYLVNINAKGSNKAVKLLLEK